jgi:hypothetical protein
VKSDWFPFLVFITLGTDCFSVQNLSWNFNTIEIYFCVLQEKQLKLGDKMDLSSYLLKPVQRMGKYALLIKQVIKECPNTAPEYHDLESAEEMVHFQLRHGNNLLAMDALKECDVSDEIHSKANFTKVVCFIFAKSLSIL